MSPVSNQSIHFRKVLRTVILVSVVAFAIWPTAAFGQATRSKIRGFWVSGSAAVTVKADRALVVMEIRSSARLSEEALCEIERLSQVVAQELEQRGLGGKYRFTANHYFSNGLPVTAPRTLTLRSFGQPHCFEVKRYVIVTFNESDLAKPGFDGLLASAIDALTNAGAQLPELRPDLGQTRFAGPVLFTVKDPEPIVLEAIRQAMDRARVLGEEVARNSGRKLGPIIDARVNRPLMLELPRQQDLTVFDELNVRYYGTSKDAVTIPATFAVEYLTK